MTTLVLESELRIEIPDDMSQADKDKLVAELTGGTVLGVPDDIMQPIIIKEVSYDNSKKLKNVELWIGNEYFDTI